MTAHNSGQGVQGTMRCEPWQYVWGSGFMGQERNQGPSRFRLYEEAPGCRYFSYAPPCDVGSVIRKVLTV
jgi:hypothetical protein